MLRGRLHDERGLTLVELMVTLSVLSLTMLLFTGAVISLQRSIDETEQRYDDIGQARLAMDATTRWLRSAITVARADTSEDTQPFMQARRTRVDFMSNIAAGGTTGVPQRVELQVVDGQLQERVWRGSIHPGSGEWVPHSATPTTTRVVARGLASPALFTFYDANGVELTPAGTANMPVADRVRVRAVGIEITVQQAPNVDVPASQLRNRVTLPNQYFFDTEEQF